MKNCSKNSTGESVRLLISMVTFATLSNGYVRKILDCIQYKLRNFAWKCHIDPQTKPSLWFVCVCVIFRNKIKMLVHKMFNSFIVHRNYYRDSPARPQCKEADCVLQIMCDLKSGKSHERRRLCRDLELIFSAY